MKTKKETICIVCGESVTAKGGLCCSSADYVDGTHEDPVCRECCTCKNSPAIWDGKSVAGGTYRACKID